jgi:hypothetical protein
MRVVRLIGRRDLSVRAPGGRRLVAPDHVGFDALMLMDRRSALGPKDLTRALFEPSRTQVDVRLEDGRVTAADLEWTDELSAESRGRKC